MLQDDGKKVAVLANKANIDQFEIKNLPSMIKVD